MHCSILSVARVSVPLLALYRLLLHACFRISPATFRLSAQPSTVASLGRNKLVYISRRRFSLVPLPHLPFASCSYLLLSLSICPHFFMFLFHSSSSCCSLYCSTNLYFFSLFSFIFFSGFPLMFSLSFCTDPRK